MASPEAYYAATAALAAADPAAVEERGRQAGAALGDDPAGAVRALREQVVARVRNADDPAIETIAGGMRLSAYLPTRTFELVVHSYDIATAVGLALPEFNTDVLGEVASLAARVAVQRGQAYEVIAALTGRRALPPGFSVV
ncbi:MAG TPA: maleylpyruvate isomerase N-terminal domain-containing protein [Propionibacteriaceae bacterium]|nr:maleylpyruvate isomerase N-terminal domain-containing protein [Propionibacteriaceae bacterium]